MPHERKLIRDAVITLLKDSSDVVARAGLTDIVPRRISPIRISEVPIICVYLDDEVTSEVQTAPRKLMRSASLFVEAWATQVDESTHIEDTLDAFALEIETALDSDPFFAGTVKTSRLARTTYGFNASGQKEMGAVQLEYEVTYDTYSRAATDLDDFVTASAKIYPSNAETPASATDVVTLPTE